MTKQEAAEILRSEYHRWGLLERLDDSHGHIELAEGCRRLMEALELGAEALEGAS